MEKIGLSKGCLLTRLRSHTILPSVLHCSTLANMVGSSLLSHYLAASKEALLEFFAFLRIYIYVSVHGSYS